MSERIETVLIDRVHIVDKISKKQTPYWIIKICVDETWFDGVCFNKEEAMEAQEWGGRKVSLLFFEDSYQGKTQLRFKLPGEKDRKIMELERRVERLEERMDKAAKLIQKLTEDEKEISKK